MQPGAAPGGTQSEGLLFGGVKEEPRRSGERLSQRPEQCMTKPMGGREDGTRTRKGKKQTKNGTASRRTD